MILVDSTDIFAGPLGHVLVFPLWLGEICVPAVVVFGHGRMLSKILAIRECGRIASAARAHTKMLSLVFL